MRVFVTGAAGFIGSHLCEALVARGDDVFAIDGFDDFLYPAAEKRKTADHLQRTLPAEKFRLREVNLDEREVIEELVASADVVVHLAALAGVRPSIADPVRYLRSNVDGTGIVLEAMRAAGKNRLVFASSSSVYGARPGDSAAFSEDDPCLQPASPYAASKRAGELLCSTYRDLYGIGVSSLRFFTVYGPRQRPDMAIHKFARAVAAGEPIAMFGDGSTRRDYTYVDDVVAGTIAAVDRVEAGVLATYNLGGDQTTSLAELVEGIERTTGLRARVEHHPPQPGDVPLTRADLSRARRDLGYEPQVPLEEGLSRFWSWFSGRRED